MLGLGGSGEQGIEVLGGGTVQTRGAWWSDSGTPGSGEAINVDDATLDGSTDLVGGVGRCDTDGAGVIRGAPLRCDTGEAKGDPNYGSAVGSIADVPIRYLPANPCQAIDARASPALEPGFYWDRDGLNRITTGGCSRRRSAARGERLVLLRLRLLPRQRERHRRCAVGRRPGASGARRGRAALGLGSQLEQRGGGCLDRSREGRPRERRRVRGRHRTAPRVREREPAARTEPGPGRAVRARRVRAAHLDLRSEDR